MAKYRLWNYDKVNAYSKLYIHADITTYEQLLELEKVSGFSWSSIVTTDDIVELLKGIHNETDLTLEAHLLED